MCYENNKSGLMLFTFGLLTQLSPAPTRHRVDEFNHPAETHRGQNILYMIIFPLDQEADEWSSFLLMALYENHTAYFYLHNSDSWLWVIKG